MGLWSKLFRDRNARPQMAGDKPASPSPAPSEQKRATSPLAQPSTPLPVNASAPSGSPAPSASASEAWAKLKRPDLMLRLLTEKERVRLDESKLRLFASDCAESVLRFFEERYPEDTRPRQAVEAARRFADGEATIDALTVAETVGLAAADTAKADADAASKILEIADTADRVAEDAYMASFRAVEAVVLGGPSPRAAALMARMKTLNEAANAASADAQVALAALKAASAAAGAAIAAMCAARTDAMSGAVDAAQPLGQ